MIWDMKCDLGRQLAHCTGVRGAVLMQALPGTTPAHLKALQSHPDTREHALEAQRPSLYWQSLQRL